MVRPYHRGDPMPEFNYRALGIMLALFAVAMTVLCAIRLVRG